VIFGEPDDHGRYIVRGWAAFVPILIWIVYFPVFESLSGQTPGKYFLGLKVVTKAGNGINFIQAFQRHLLDWMDLGTFGLTSILTIQNSDYCQKPADLWAETVVIGGESVLCPNCRDSISLNPDEITAAKFTCPSCNQNIIL
jgi:uncharacterized RDD family membrane protein YckC